MSYTSRSRLVISALTVMAASCLAVKPHVTPTPTVLIACVVSDGTVPIEGAYCGAEGFSNITNADGYAIIGRVSIGVPHTLTVVREGFYQYRGDYTVNADTNIPITLEAIPNHIPPAPDRSTALAINSHGMQGLVCHTEQFGDLYWWDAALPWLNAQDRQSIYACKHAVNDTHQLIQLPWGPPLYDECCNDYSPDRFGALDWTGAADRSLRNLTDEVVHAGFLPIIFLGGDDGERGYPRAVSQLPDVVRKLQGEPDLNPYVCISPAFDGAFYGWTKEHIEAFAQQFRALEPNGCLVFEFSTGHIPQEAGIDMSGYDAEFIEFERDLHNWNFWQIVPRLIGEPRYHRPSDDTSPHPVPRMPMQTARGEIQTVCFEWKTYWWVRRQETVVNVDADRAYALAAGCPAID